MYGLQFFGVSNSLEKIFIDQYWNGILNNKVCFLKQIKRVLSEPCQEKTCFLHMRKQRHRSAAR